MAMRIFWSALLFSTALLTLPAAADSYDGIHTVAIISVIGDVLHVKTVGMTAFGNGAGSALIGRWGLDASVTKWITTAVTPRFKLVPLTVDREKWAECADVTACLSALPTDRPEIDAYIVVQQAMLPDPLGSNQDLFGLGLYHHEGMLSAGVSGLYAGYRVSVLDARTNTEIESATARLPTGNFLGRAFPWVSMEAQYWPVNGYDALDDAAKATLQARVTRLVEISLAVALHSVDLMPAPPTVDSVGPMVLGKTPIPYFDTPRP